jgi:hypothetical protein
LRKCVDNHSRFSARGLLGEESRVFADRGDVRAFDLAVDQPALAGPDFATAPIGSPPRDRQFPRRAEKEVVSDLPPKQSSPDDELGKLTDAELLEKLRVVMEAITARFESRKQSFENDLGVQGQTARRARAQCE